MKTAYSLVLVVIFVVFTALSILHYCEATYQKKNSPSYRGDYQIDVDNDSIYIMDGVREVGRFKLEYDADPLGTMILEDNK